MAYYMVRYSKATDEYRVCPLLDKGWAEEKLGSVFLNTKHAIVSIVEADDHLDALEDGIDLIDDYREKTSLWRDELGKVRL